MHIQYDNADRIPWFWKRHLLAEQSAFDTIKAQKANFLYHNKLIKKLYNTTKMDSTFTNRLCEMPGAKTCHGAHFYKFARTMQYFMRCILHFPAQSYEAHKRTFCCSAQESWAVCWALYLCSVRLLLLTLGRWCHNCRLLVGAQLVCSQSKFARPICGIKWPGYGAS